MRKKELVINLNRNQTKQLNDFLKKYKKEDDMQFLFFQFNTKYARRNENSIGCYFLSTDDRNDSVKIYRFVRRSQKLIGSATEIK